MPHATGKLFWAVKGPKSFLYQSPRVSKTFTAELERRAPDKVAAWPYTSAYDSSDKDIIAVIQSVGPQECLEYDREYQFTDCPEHNKPRLIILEIPTGELYRKYHVVDEKGQSLSDVTFDWLTPLAKVVAAIQLAFGVLQMAAYRPESPPNFDLFRRKALDVVATHGCADNEYIKDLVDVLHDPACVSSKRVFIQNIVARDLSAIDFEIA